MPTQEEMIIEMYEKVKEMYKILVPQKSTAKTKNEQRKERVAASWNKTKLRYAIKNAKNKLK